MRARHVLAAVLVLALAAGLLAGCSKKIHPVGNMAPETYLFVQGPIDTVNHRVHLYWYGTDPDGSVAAYAIRWVYPGQDAGWDTIKVRGNPAPRDSMFTIFTGDTSTVMPRFEVFAIDNEGMRDPSVASEDFTLSNRAPVVHITDPLGTSDSTFASVTFHWNTDDPDGGGPDLRYYVWLDGNAATPDVTDQEEFTVPSARFLRSGVYPPTGPRTVFVQAVDDGGRHGPVASFTWTVRPPADQFDNNQARLLVIDDTSTEDPNNLLLDSFYSAVYTLLPPGTYTVLRPQVSPRVIRSSADLAQTFGLFKAVLWYRGGIPGRFTSPWLRNFEEGVGEYLDHGGNLYVDGLYLINGLRSPGALSMDFVTSHCGSDGLYNCYTTVERGIVDSTAGWGNRNGGFFRSTMYGDPASSTFRSILAATSRSDSSAGLRAFVVRDTANVAFWAMAGVLSPGNSEDLPVGVTVPQGQSGKLVLLTIPPLYGGGNVANTRNFLRRILNSFGTGVPLP